MIIHGVNKHLYMSPDGDGAGGGGGTSSGTATPPAPPAPAPPAPKTYTQQEKDTDEAKLRRRYDREIKELKQTAAKQTASIEELKAQATNPLPPSITPPASDGSTEGRIELLEKRYARTEEELNTKIQAAQDAAEQEKQTRLRLQRDQKLDEALREAGVLGKHMIQARRYFLPQVEWDELEGETGGWVFRTRDKNFVPILDGVAEELPDNLKPSKMKHGGAGNMSGLPQHQQRKQRELEDAKKELAELKEVHRQRGGKNSDMMAFTKQKRLVEALERELSAPK